MGAPPAPKLYRLPPPPKLPSHHQVLLGSSGAAATTGTATAGAGIGISGGGGAFPLHQLCVAEGKAAWALSLDVYILNADGAVFDAVLLAAVAALAGTQVRRGGEGGLVK